VRRPRCSRGRRGRAPGSGAGCVYDASMINAPDSHVLLDKAARATPEPLARRVRGLSDRAIAWLFIAPTIVLLLAINIFPLIWTVRLSFSNYRVNRPNVPLKWLGIEHYTDILGDADIWNGMQVTARFVLATITIETLLG